MNNTSVTNNGARTMSSWRFDKDYNFSQFPPIANASTNISLNIGDSWKTVVGAQINIGDTWKTVVAIKINIGDVWKTVF